MTKKLNSLLLIFFIIIFFIYCGRESKTVNFSQKYTETCKSFSLTGIFDEQGKRIDDSQVNEAKVSWCLLSFEDKSHMQFNGVGRYGGCTGSLLDTESENGPAYILTNGHCVGRVPPASEYAPPKGAFFDISQDSNKSMTFNYFKNAQNSNFITYSTKIIRYVSMDNTDVALIELDTSLKKLKELGVKAYKISSANNLLGKEVYVVGSPLNGVNSNNYGIRYDSCKLDDDTVSLREGDFSFNKSYKVTCSVVGGSSGSPVFNLEDQTIIGLMNTGVDSSKENSPDCTLGKPCEVSESEKITTNLERNYFQSVVHLQNCFTEFGIFDKNNTNCKLSQL